MYEIDRYAFGAFLATQRKEKGYTQKDLAAKLYISGKAVSKWERGLSLPDVQLLIPLAEALEVSVAELLEGRKSEPSSAFNTEQVNELIQKALSVSGNPLNTHAERRLTGLCLLAGLCAVMIPFTATVQCGVFHYLLLDRRFFTFTCVAMLVQWLLLRNEFLDIAVWLPLAFSIIGIPLSQLPADPFSCFEYLVAPLYFGSAIIVFSTKLIHHIKYSP